MRFRPNNANQKLYLKIFMPLILCIVTTLLIVSTVLYINFEKVASNQIYLANIKNLEQVSAEVSIMANMGVTLSNQIYQDPSVSKLLYFKEPEVFDLSLAISQLKNYRLSVPYIDSIYVYNSNTDTIYTESSLGEATQNNYKEFSDKQVTNVLGNYRNYKPYIPIPRKQLNTNGIEKYYYTFIMYNVITGNKLDSAIITNLSEDWIHSAINGKSDAKVSDTFIMDSKGVLVSNGVNFPMLSDYSNKDYINNILHGSETSGYFISNVNKIKSLVVYTMPDEFGWRYVRVLNWSTIFNKIESIRKLTIIIGLGILLLGILISFFISRRIYFPISKILLDLEDLQVEKRENNQILRQEFLRDLVLGRQISSEADMQEGMKKLSISISNEGEIYVLLFKIDHYNTFIQKYNIEEQNLYKFAIMNIASEIFLENCKAETVDMGNDAILVIVEGSDGDRSERFKRIQSTIFEHLKVSISMTVSSSIKNFENINQLYNQVLESSLHRLFYGHGSVIFSSIVMQYKEKEYIYPIQKEKLLIDALMVGREIEARKIYDEIIGYTYTYSFFVYSLTISHLMVALNDAINTIKKNNSISDNLNFIIPIIMLNDAETIEEVNNKFYELFEGIERILEEKKNSKHDIIINRVNEIINSKYFDQSLSVDSIADSIGISKAYICRIYKQLTLHTILDDIVKVRMGKARELLLETNCRIEEIAEKVGFSNSSYFYKAFKTVNGVTPSEFRKTKK